MSNEQKNSSHAAKAAQMAQLARGVSEIIKGAMAGGIKGAAIAAAKNFAPQIIKFIAITIFVILLLPALIFFALPSIFFQLPSVNSASLLQMTDQSAQLEFLHSHMNDFTRDEAVLVCFKTLIIFYDIQFKFCRNP